MATNRHDRLASNVDLEKLAAVRKRYEEEARKRFRPEGLAQFVPLKATDDEKLRALSNDPWVDHSALNIKSPPIQNGETYRHFIVGAGFGGLVYAIQLIESDVATANDIRLVDAAGGFGGTRWFNRYPGLHCDVESYMYLPLLEETGYVLKLKYAPGKEIREHAERIAQHWKLTDKALFRTEVKRRITFTENRGPLASPIEYTVRSQYVYLAAGVLTRPQVPRIPGLDQFKGHMFHTARWNYKISGGSQEDQTLTGFNGKRVAVIGTAATGIGVIPEIAKYAKELYVFQRTPSYVKPRNQQVTDVKKFRAEVANKTGGQFERQANWNRHLTNSVPPGIRNLVADGWTDMPAYATIMGDREAYHEFHALDLPHGERVRKHIDEIVHDADTAEKLKPWYPSWCKRHTFSDTFISLFNSPHVHLVDTNGQGVTTATIDGLVVGNKEYPVDIVIFSTGFQVPAARLGSPAARTGVQVLGRGRVNLDDKWVSNGAATLHGYQTSQFPNLFFSGTAQATITGNNIWMLSLIAKHVSYIIGAAERRVSIRQRAVIEVKKEAEEAYTQQILKGVPYFGALGGCTPGYFNAYGEGAAVTDPAEKLKRARGGTWSGGTLSFLEFIGKWRDEGKLKGLDIRAATELKIRL